MPKVAFVILTILVVIIFLVFVVSSAANILFNRQVEKEVRELFENNPEV